jgi:hypothetical protein
MNEVFPEADGRDDTPVFISTTPSGPTYTWRMDAAGNWTVNSVWAEVDNSIYGVAERPLTEFDMELQDNVDDK